LRVIAPTALMRALARSRSGVAATEFALSLPLLLTAGLYGIESANQAVMQMRVSQIAVLIADNASRVGENSLLGETKIYEADINDVFMGAEVQSGSRFDLYENGRVTLSSLEVVPGTEDQQYIHWQRCKGKKIEPSSYGEAGDGLGSQIEGMGPAGEEIQAIDDEAVMFVEVVMDYRPLVGEIFAGLTQLRATAAFNVRENRDLTQVYQRDPAKPAPISSCDKHDGIET
jgi:hypothetical protein